MFYWLSDYFRSMLSQFQPIEEYVAKRRILLYHNCPPSKNAVSACQISWKLLSFTTFYYFFSGRFLKKWPDNQCSSITKGSIYHIKHVHIALYHTSWLTRNLMFNGSIYYVLCLQILHFYLLGQMLHIPCSRSILLRSIHSTTILWFRWRRKTIKDGGRFKTPCHFRDCICQSQC